MSKSTVLLAFTTAAFGIGSIYGVLALRAEHHRAEDLQARVTELEHAARLPASTESRKVADASAPTRPPAESPPAPHLKTASASPAAVTASKKNRGSDGSEFSRLLTNPAYRAAELAYSRLEVERQYPDLATALNLRPDEADRLFDLLARQALSEREYALSRNDEGQLSDAAAVRARQQRNEERRKATDAERAALLGETKLNELNQYLNSLGARSQIRELRTMLAESSFPLRDDQAAPLIASLAAEQQRHTAERDKLYNSARNATHPTSEEVIRYMSQRLELIEQSLERRRHAASAYLDSEQRKRYEEMLARERKRAQIDYDLAVAVNQQAPRNR